MRWWRSRCGDDQQPPEASAAEYRLGRRRAAVVAAGAIASPLMPSRGPGKLEPLTSLRFFAAAAIVLHHTQEVWVPTGFWLPFLLDQAVAFFFVLSGFILTYVHPALPTRDERRRFWLARFARIWPAHATSFALLFVLLPDPGGVFTGAARGGVALLNLAMLQAWIPVEAINFSYNSPSWSISTEFGFYLLFPFLIQRLRDTWWWKLAGTGALVAALCWLCDAIGGRGPDAPALGSLVYVNPLARAFEFTLGMCTALLLPALGARLRGRVALATAVEVAALAAMATNAAYAASTVHAWHTGGRIGYAFALWLVHGGMCCVPFAGVVLVFACGAGWISRLLSARWLVLLGEISFTMYLLHQILLRVIRAHPAEFEAVPPWLQMLGFAALLVVASHWIWAAVERPLRARILALGGVRASARGAREPARGALGALFAPTRRWLVLEALATAAIAALGVAGIRAQGPPAFQIPAAEIAARRDRTDASVRDARFGDVFVLQGLGVDRSADAVDVELAWQALRLPPHGTLVALHVLDAEGRIVAQGDYLPDVRRWYAGRIRIDRAHIPQVPASARRLGIVVAPPRSGYLAVDRGARDWSGGRLLVDLPSDAAPDLAADPRE